MKNIEWKILGTMYGVAVGEALCGRAVGNGALMRTAYVGVYCNSQSDIRRYVDEVCCMTHWDYTAAVNCQNCCNAIHDCLTIEDPEECKRHLFEAFADKRADGVRDLCKLAEDSYTPRPTGYGVDSLNAALHCIFTTKTFEDAVVKAVNLGGDADTIGAITGGLAGAIYGYPEIPGRWILKLDPSVSSKISILCVKAAKNHQSRENG